MRPPNDEELILYYYGESDETDAVEAAIEHSAEVAQRYDTIRRVLDAVPRDEIPPRSELYGRQMWRRVSPRLADAASPGGRGDRATASGPSIGKAAGWALAATLLVVLAYWAGRQTASPPEAATALTEAGRQRILRSTVAEHLERSRFLLEEIANGEVEASDATLSPRLERLTTDNRIYRQAARHRADPDLVLVLEELERFLIELAHSDPSAADGRRLGERLDETGLLFKIRVLIAVLERGAAAPTPPTATT